MVLACMFSLSDSVANWIHFFQVLSWIHFIGEFSEKWYIFLEFLPKTFHASLFLILSADGALVVYVSSEGNGTV